MYQQKPVFSLPNSHQDVQYMSVNFVAEANISLFIPGTLHRAANKRAFVRKHVGGFRSRDSVGVAMGLPYVISTGDGRNTKA